jgi:hypothetical protein
MFPRQRFNYNNENRCFLSGPCQGIINETSLEFSQYPVWRLHIEMIEAKVFRTLIRIYSLFKSERLNTNINLTIHKALIRSMMIYACPVWEFVADNNLLKMQHLQNKGFRIIENFRRRTQIRDLQMVFKLPYI